MEISLTDVSARFVIFTFTVANMSSGIGFHAYDRSLPGVEATISLGNVEPPSVEYSSFTLAIVPVLTHVIFSEAPTFQDSPPFGVTMVSDPLISKSATDVSATESSLASATLTRMSISMASGIVHA